MYVKQRCGGDNKRFQIAWYETEFYFINLTF